jgi:hypothetical protein
MRPVLAGLFGVGRRVFLKAPVGSKPAAPRSEATGNTMWLISMAGIIAMFNQDKLQFAAADIRKSLNVFGTNTSEASSIVSSYENLSRATVEVVESPEISTMSLYLSCWYCVTHACVERENDKLRDDLKKMVTMSYIKASDNNEIVECGGVRAYLESKAAQYEIPIGHLRNTPAIHRLDLLQRYATDIKNLSLELVNKDDKNAKADYLMLHNKILTFYRIYEEIPSPHSRADKDLKSEVNQINYDFTLHIQAGIQTRQSKAREALHVRIDDTHDNLSRVLTM